MQTHFFSCIEAAGLEKVGEIIQSLGGRDMQRALCEIKFLLENASDSITNSSLASRKDHICGKRPPSKKMQFFVYASTSVLKYSLTYFLEEGCIGSQLLGNNLRNYSSSWKTGLPWANRRNGKNRRLCLKAFHLQLPNDDTKGSDHLHASLGSISKACIRPLSEAKMPE